MIYRERINGITKHSLKYFEKHIDKIGKIQSITAYHIVSSKQGCKQANVRISIKGINGTIVLGGLSWGYHGEGSRGLSQVFHKCSISDIIPFTNVLGVFLYLRIKLLSLSNIIK
jgi:hypothetical protein